MQHHNGFQFAIILTVLILLTASSSSFSHAQVDPRIQIPFSYNPVGSGARALGMGGAFIAIADDATAASWNPGGLIQLETPEISIVGTYFDRTENNSFKNEDADDQQTVNDANINYLSAAHPFTAWNRNMIISASHQYLYDLNRTLKYPVLDTSQLIDYNGRAKFDHEGNLSAIGIAYAVQATPRLSVGFTLNFWQDGLYDNRLRSTVTETGSGTVTANGNSYTLEYDQEDLYSYRGLNANFGILWNIGSQFSMGAVLKTPFTAEVDHSHTEHWELRFPDNPVLSQIFTIDEDTDEEIDFPMSYGIGFANRFSDTFTISFDIYRTEWDNFIITEEDGDERSPITGERADEVDIEQTTQARFGLEYLIIFEPYVIPFRGGLFYDPTPADGELDDFYGFSCGSGFAKGKIVFDIAYQYRFGNDVSEYILKEFDFSQNVLEHTVYASVIYHF